MKKLENKDASYTSINPHYNNFKGTIIKIDEMNYITKGLYKLNKHENKLEITELPIGKWTDDYIKFIQENIQKDEKHNFITDYENHSTDSEVHIICKVTDEFIFDFEHSSPDENGTNYVEKHMKLTSNKSLTNLHLYNKDNQIQKFTLSAK